MNMAEEQLAIWTARRNREIALRPDPYSIASARKDSIRYATKVDGVRGVSSRKAVALRTWAWSAEWTLPVKSPIGLIVYVHGANSYGSIATYRYLTSELCVRSRCRIFTLEYRRPPEASYPAPYDDLLSALEYLKSTKRPTQTTIIAADSFGATPALAAAIHLRDTGQKLAGLYFICPKTDYSTTPVLPLPDRDPVKCPASKAAWGYMNDIGASDWRSSPYLSNLANLPPTLIQSSVGDNAGIRANTLALVNKLTAAGNACTMQDWQIEPHIWPFYGRSFTASREALTAAGIWIKARALAAREL